MNRIKKYFPELTQQQFDQFEALQALYTDWNSKINVISRKDIDELYIRHVLHSLAIAKYIQFTPSTKLLDVGTGGGFPGIPLAVLFPECDFVLVDSIAKKLKVVTAVAEAIQLNNITTQHSRVEAINQQFDFVVSRAVTQMETFVSWTKSKIHNTQRNTLKNGILYLKGGDLTVELKPFSQAEIYNLNEVFTEPFFDTKKLVYLPILN